ncbi:bacteriorhodopsin-like protein [Roseiarcus fermentans]|uniref:Bacteriorhodopsin-like protein n=2 Tax=Roseiarcus fermentans TaxID=1473586 RepID=A0A366FQZ4_9HYPH|nr:bacteriorhodopsin-like protein [Roseiarcus fermentans]
MTTMIDPQDLTGASYSALLYALAGATVFLLLGVSWVERGWKLVVGLAAIAMLVGACQAYDSRAAWVAAKSVSVAYPYAGWIISMPVQVLTLFFLAGRGGKVSQALFWRLAVVSILMVLVRYLGDAKLMAPTLAFLIGVAFWLYILGELYFGQMDEAVATGGGDALRRGYFWLRIVATVGWAIYPLGSFIVSFTSAVDDGRLSLAYNLAEFVNLIAFGLAVLATAMASADNDRVAAR